MKYTAANTIGTMSRIRTIPTMRPMFVGDPGSSVGLTAAAKKMRETNIIKTKSAIKRNNTRQQTNKKTTTGKKQMKNYIKQRRGKNELCFQNNKITRLAKFHSSFLLANRILY